MMLKWSRTWPGDARSRDDFLARDPDHPRAFLRVYLSVSHNTDRPWFWTASDGHRDLGTGYEASPKEAALAAETVYLTRA